MAAVLELLSQPLVRTLLALVVLVLTIVLSWNNRRTLGFLTLRIWYELPFVGRIAQLSKDLHKNLKTGWFHSEWELCNAFYRYYPKSEDVGAYDKATSYLEKAHQIDRREIPWFGWPLMFALLVAEAGSLGLLLAVFVSPTTTFKTQSLLGWIAATIVAGIMFYITHRAGREFYVNDLRSRVREGFREWGEQNTDKTLPPKRSLALDHTDEDNDAPQCVQLANRVDGGSLGRYQPSRFFSAIAVSLIAFFAIASFILRDQLLEGVVSNTAALAWAKAGDQSRGSLVAFGILSVLFIGVQIISGSLGYYYGFAGRVARQAARVRAGFAVNNDYVAYHEEQKAYVERIAQHKLTKLQNKMADQDPRIPTTHPEDRTFRIFCTEKEHPAPRPAPDGNTVVQMQRPASPPAGE